VCCFFKWEKDSRNRQVRCGDPPTHHANPRPRTHNKRQSPTNPHPQPRNHRQSPFFWREGLRTLLHGRGQGMLTDKARHIIN